MKKRWPLLIVFVLLAGIALWLVRTHGDSTLAGPLTDFAISDTASVDRIFIAEKQGNTIDLRRIAKAGGGTEWTVNGLRATQVNVSLLLKTFIRIEVESPVPKSAEASVLKVMSSTARKVEIYQGGKEPSKIWWVGHATQDHFGTYMLLEEPGVGKSSSPFIMGVAGFTGILPPRFHTRIDEWRNTEVTTYPDLTQVKKIQVDQPSTPDQSFTLTYDGASNFGLFDHTGTAVPMDTAHVKDLMLLLRNGHFEAFERKLTKAQRDSLLATPPWHVLTVTSTQGEQKVPFWRKNPDTGERDMDFNLITNDVDRMYALLGDTSLVILQRYWYDRVVPPLDLLRAKAPRTAGSAAMPAH